MSPLTETPPVDQAGHDLTWQQASAWPALTAFSFNLELSTRNQRPPTALGV